MQRYRLEQFEDLKDGLAQSIRNGSVAILPTDSIYGITVSAFNEEAVRKVSQIKRREQPSSIIPHSVSWARSVISKKSQHVFDRLQEQNFVLKTGKPATFLFEISESIKSSKLAPELYSSGLISFRFPQMWLLSYVKEIKEPCITTSVNIHGQPYMKTFADLGSEMISKIDWMVDVGYLDAKPSTLVFTKKSSLTYKERDA